MRWAVGLLGVTAVVAFPDAAGAQSSPIGPSLSYTAPPSCPVEADFVRRTAARLGASPGPQARTLTVHIAPATDSSGGRSPSAHATDGPFLGRVTLTGADGRSTTKTLSARDCDDLVDALSLVAALALRSEPGKPVGETGDQPEAAPPAPPAPAAQPSAAPVAAAPAPAPPPEPDLASSALRDRTARTGFDIDLGGLVASGPAPEAVFAGTVGVGWAQDRGFLSPAVGVGVAAGASPSVSESGGRASFAWLVARLEGCGVRVAIAGVMLVRGCLLGDFGWVNARGSDTDSPASSSRGWISLGASTRWELPLGPRFGVHLVAGVEAPLRRDRYAFGASDFFQVPAVMATASASAAAYFR
jgi:hypothetical protein